MKCLYFTMQSFWPSRALLSELDEMQEGWRTEQNRSRGRKRQAGSCLVGLFSRAVALTASLELARGVYVCPGGRIRAEMKVSK